LHSVEINIAIPRTFVGDDEHERIRRFVRTLLEEAGFEVPQTPDAERHLLGLMPTR
jgi:methylmalonyl-CoA mutase cobalamin-binding subunit